MNAPKHVNVRLDMRLGGCDLRAPDSVHDLMWDYTSPFVTTFPSKRDPNLTIEVAVAPQSIRSARMSLAGSSPVQVRASHPTHRYLVWASGSGEVFLPEHADDHLLRTVPNTVKIAANSAQVGATIAIRVLRQFMMRMAEAQHGIHAHAAVVAVGGNGLIVGGHPGAGKTTVLTHLVERHGLAPVANDRAVIVPDGGDWNAIGVPLAWRYTPEGVRGSTALQAALRMGHVRRRDIGLVDGKVELTPLEASRYLGRSASPSVRVSRIVVLARRDRELVDAEPDLAEHIGFGASDPFAEDWLRMHPWFTSSEQASDGTNAWKLLSAQVPVEVHTWTDPSELAGIADKIHWRALS